MANYVKKIVLMGTGEDEYEYFGVCSACGARNLATSRFCHMCGQPFDSDQAVIQGAIERVNAYIERGEDDENSFERAADDVIHKFPFKNMDAKVIIEGLKKEFANRAFPEVSRRDAWQFMFLNDLGIRLSYQRIDRTTFSITVTTKCGSVHREAKIREAFPSPFDTLNAFYLDGDPLRDILTDEQFYTLKCCKEINLHWGFFEK